MVLFLLRLTLPVVGDRMNQQSGGEGMRSKRISEVLRFAVAGVAGFAVELLVLILLIVIIVAGKKRKK